MKRLFNSRRAPQELQAELERALLEAVAKSSAAPGRPRATARDSEGLDRYLDRLSLGQARAAGTTGRRLYRG